MKKSELETGMICKLRNNDEYVVMLNCNYKTNNVLLSINNDSLLRLCIYGDDLKVTPPFDEEFDIIKVYRKAPNKILHPKLISSMETVFERRIYNRKREIKI